MQYFSNGLRRAIAVGAVALTSVAPINGQQPNPNYSRFDRGNITCHENRNMVVTNDYVDKRVIQDKWTGKTVQRVSCSVIGLGRNYESISFDGQLVEFRYWDPNHKSPITGEIVYVTIFEQPLGAGERQRITKSGNLLVSADSTDAREMADMHRASVESTMKPEYCKAGRCK